MNLSYCPYDLLYNTNDGQRFKISELKLIAPDHEDEDIENYFEYAQEVEDDENNEISIYNGNNELVKIFNEKCVICLENDSIYAFRNCGHQTICNDCYNNSDSNKLTKCVFCQC